jgi:hypothetical protein
MNDAHPPGLSIEGEFSRGLINGKWPDVNNQAALLFGLDQIVKKFRRSARADLYLVKRVLRAKVTGKDVKQHNGEQDKYGFDFHEALLVLVRTLKVRSHT